MGAPREANRILLCAQTPARRIVLTYSVFAVLGLVIFFAGHFLLQTNILTSDRFSIYRDRGYPEYFQYTLAAIAALSFFYVAWKKQIFAYLVPAGIMTYLVLDDAFSIHERAGAFLASERPIIAPFKLSSMHIGEALFLSLAGISFLVVLFFAYIRSQQKVRFDLIIFTTILFIAGIFGIVFDALSVFTKIGFFGFAEDSGEMISVALISIFAVDRATGIFTMADTPALIKK